MLVFRDEQIKELKSKNAQQGQEIDALKIDVGQLKGEAICKDQKITNLSALCVSKSLSFMNLQDRHREDREKLQAVGQEMRTLILALSSMEADTRLIRASVQNDSEAHMEEWRRAEFDRLLREFEALTPVRPETPEPQDAEPEEEEDEQDAEPEHKQDTEPEHKKDEQDAQTPAPQDEKVKRQLEEFAARTLAYQKQDAEDKRRAQQKREAAEAAEREALEERKAEQDRVAARKEAHQLAKEVEKQLAKEAEKQKREAARRNREEQRLRKAERRAQRQALAAEPVAEPVPDVPEVVPDTWEQLAPEQSSPVVEQPPEEKGQGPRGLAPEQSSPVVEQPPEEKGQGPRGLAPEQSSPVVEQPPEEKGRSLPGHEHPQARSIAVALLVNQRRREKQADRYEKFLKIVQEVFDKTDNHDFTIACPNHEVYMALEVYTHQCLGMKAYGLERKYDRSKYRLVTRNTVVGVECHHTSPWVNPANIVFWLNEPTFVDACKDFFGFEPLSNDTPEVPQFIDYMFKPMKQKETFRALKLRPVKNKKDIFDLPLQQITVATGETVIGPMVMMILWFLMGKISYLARVEADA
jgi:hypothetical protein